MIIALTLVRLSYHGSSIGNNAAAVTVLQTYMSINALISASFIFRKPYS